MDMLSKKLKMPEVVAKKKSERTFIQRIGKAGLYVTLIGIAIIQLFPYILACSIFFEIQL